jgi:16S rRNA (adenine1518-N6/adenine1519-N6)-dimethyltransferase
MASQSPVRAKKHLGQHFLKDENIARKIALTLGDWSGPVLEIGPGMGVLTKLLPQEKTYVVEIDQESIDYLAENSILPASYILNQDFLKMDLASLPFEDEWAVIGNFPYNISSQIVFKVLENRNRIPRFSGMFQKEVAERIAMPPGSKLYGILSVLCQAFYDVKYEFSVSPNVFNPPPKVQSGVITMIRKSKNQLSCDEKLFFKLVKMAFNQRRKMLRVSLKSMINNEEILQNPIMTKRPEQLGYQEFEYLTTLVERQSA